MTIVPEITSVDGVARHSQIIRLPAPPSLLVDNNCRRAGTKQMGARGEAQGIRWYGGLHGQNSARGKFRTSPRKMRGKFRTKLKYGIFPAEKSPRGISPPPVLVSGTGLFCTRCAHSQGRSCEIHCLHERLSYNIDRHRGRHTQAMCALRGHGQIQQLPCAPLPDVSMCRCSANALPDRRITQSQGHKQCSKGQTSNNSLVACNKVDFKARCRTFRVHSTCHTKAMRFLQEHFRVQKLSIMTGGTGVGDHQNMYVCSHQEKNLL